MKDYVNPLLLLVVVALFAWAFQGPAEESAAFDPALWLLVLCATGCVVNGLLCMARLLAHRPVLMGAVWSMVYLVLGSVGWLFIARAAEEQSEQHTAYAALTAAEAPAAQADESGECRLSYAAALGKTRAVRQMLADPAVAGQTQVVLHAALRAAENGQCRVLQLMVPQYAAPTAAEEGMPLAVAAAVNGHLKATELLLALGADVNAADADGRTALMHAAINDDVPMLRLLLQHGAAADRTDAQGLRAADVARGAAAECLEQHAAQPQG